MDPNRWEVIRAAFDELVELDAAERASRLAALDAVDPELRVGVEPLLSADGQIDRRLARVESTFLPPASGPGGHADAAAPPPDLFNLSGRTVSHFRVLEPLGAGGMGVVYRAEDTRLGRAVALKFLLPHYSLDASAKARFLHEAQAAAALDHPNLCTIHDLGETDDGRLFLAMALYPGETLEARLKRLGAPLPLGEALEITRQIAEGLVCAHAAGIVHRDLKPGNVILMPDGAVKLLDFGLAKARNWSSSATRMRFGTASYMAPEQIRGDPVDGRTDLWALGVMLYQMLTGRKPFAGDYEVAIAHAILHKEPLRPSALGDDVPGAIEAVILTLLEKDAARRYATAEQLLEALPATVGLLDESAMPGPRRRRSFGRRIHRTGRNRMVVVAAPLGVAAALAVSWWGVREFSSGTPTVHSIAVLPFANLTGDSAQAYFVDGMHEALTAELTRISALSVIPRTSAMQYKGVSKPASQIARELGVQWLIEGSVAREREQVRITAQLIHGPANRYLWGDSYRRDLRGILALQAQLALEIAGAVRVRLTPAEEARLAAARPVHPEAYDLYLRGRHFKHQEAQDHSWLRARWAFEQSVALDSGLAPAWAGLAMMYALQAYSSWPDSALRARAALAKALALDSSLPDAHVSLALVRQLLDWDWKGAEQAFRRALELDPNNWEAHYEYGLLLLRLGRLDDGLAAMFRTRELAPFSPTAHHGVAWAHLAARRYDEAIATVRSALELHPNNAMLRGDYASALKLGGSTEEYKRADREYYALCCGISDTEYRELNSTRFRRYLASGERGKALELLRDLESEGKYEWDLALGYIEAGDPDRALRILEQAADQRIGSINWIKVEPQLDPLRSEPRFQALLKRVGLDQ